MPSVDDYIASQPEAVRPLLGLVRRTILAAVPKAVESVSYQIPTYTLPAGPLLFFTAWKQHYSIYPATDAVLAKFAGPLARFKIVKRTIRFSYSEPVPVELIAGLAKFRARELALRPRARNFA